MPSVTDEHRERTRSIIKGLGWRADQAEPIGGYLRNFVQIIDFGKLCSPNTQIIYGRNGTGKTHFLKAYSEYCVTQFTTIRTIPVYVDFRNLDYFR
jgi:hypothetical protein